MLFSRKFVGSININRHKQKFDIEAYEELQNYGPFRIAG